VRILKVVELEDIGCGKIGCGEIDPGEDTESSIDSTCA